MDPASTRSNGHSAPRHTSQERLRSGIGQTARAISSQIDRVYERWDQAEGRLQQWLSTAEARPARFLAVTFLAGIVVGIWLAPRK